MQIRSEILSTKDDWSLAESMHTESYISSKPYFLAPVLSLGTQTSTRVWAHPKSKQPFKLSMHTFQPKRRHHLSFLLSAAKTTGWAEIVNCEVLGLILTTVKQNGANHQVASNRLGKFQTKPPTIRNSS